MFFFLKKKITFKLQFVVMCQMLRVFIFDRFESESEDVDDPSTEYSKLNLRPVFSGKRNWGKLIEVVESEVNSPHQMDACQRFEDRYKNVPCDWKHFEVCVYNTLSLHTDSKDCRNRLRCCPHFHGRPEYSCIQLKSPIRKNGVNYRYGYCLLFFSVALEDLVLVRLLREIDNSVDSEYDYLDTREVFGFIQTHYTILRGDQTGSLIREVNTNDILRQEQFCEVGNDLVLVNHYCHGNIFTSS